jgi:hypothetical protein
MPNLIGHLIINQPDFIHLNNKITALPKNRTGGGKNV